MVDDLTSFTVAKSIDSDRIDFIAKKVANRESLSLDRNRLNGDPFPLQRWPAEKARLQANLMNGTYVVGLSH